MIGLALATAALAAAFDVRTGRIPDLLTGAAMGLGMGLAASRGLEAGLLAVFWMGLALFACIMREGLGGGDAKLAMAVGALSGPYVLVAGAVAIFVIELLPRRIVRPAGPPILAGVATATLLELLC